MMTASIVTMTLNPTIDKSAKVEQIIADQKLRCRSVRREPGGGGLNVSRAICRLGGHSLALYTAGGPIGQLLQALLDAEGVDHRPLAIEAGTRENFVAFEAFSDHQYRFGMPGPTLQAVEWPRCLAALEGLDPAPDYLVASGSLPPGAPDDFYARVARIGREANSRVIIDTKGDPLRLAAEEGVYLLKPNFRELRQLSGTDLKTEPEQEEAARALIRSGQSEVVVLSLGSAGALLVTGQEKQRLRAPTVQIDSKIGAGDSMVGGIVLALARGRSLPEAVRFGVAAGAAAVMTPGTELCRRDDTERLYQMIDTGG